MRFAWVVALLLSGCALRLRPINGEDEVNRDGVTVSYCGTERESVTVGAWLFTTKTDTGRVRVCIVVQNEGAGAIVVDRKKTRLLADGFRGVPLDDGQENEWPIKAGNEETILLLFDASDLARGDRVNLSFKGAVSRSDEPVAVPALRFAYR